MVESGENEKYEIFLGLFALVVLVFVPYIQLGNQAFIALDDAIFFFENTYLHNGLTLRGVQWAMTATDPGYWHPVYWLSYMLDISLFGIDAGATKLMNAFIHYCNAVMVFLFFYWTTRRFWPGLLIGALFAVHPLHVESIAWVIERKDVLFLFFGLLSLHTYYRYCLGKSKIVYVASLLFFSLGLMSKTTVASLPILLLLLDLWPLERIDLSSLFKVGVRVEAWRKVRLLVLEKIPYLLLGGIVSAVVKYYTVSYGKDGVYAGVKSHWMPDWLFSYVLYVWKIIVPTGLVIHHPLLAYDKSLMLASGLTLLILGSALALWLFRRAPYVTMGWFWFVVALIPSFGLYTVAGLHGAMYDRLVYLPSIGLYVCFAFGLWELCQRFLNRNVFLLIAGIILTVLAGLTWKQVGYWKDSKTLFEHAAAESEDNWLAYSQLGQLKADAGDYGGAIELLDKSLAIEPSVPNTVKKLGRVYFRSNDWDKARVLFDGKIEQYPENIGLRHDYGSLLIDMGEFDLAIEQLSPLVGEDYYLKVVHHNLATAYYKNGDLEDALKHSLTANRLEPNNPNLMYALAVIYAHLGRMDEAKSMLLQIREIDPKNKAVARALRAMGTS